jgi:hypothetical protein
MSETVINIGIVATFVLLGLAALLVIVFAILQLFANFKKAKGGLIGLAALALILFLSYLMSTSEAYETVGPVTSQWIGGGITATFILIGLAFLAAVFTEVYKLIR